MLGSKPIKTPLEVNFVFNHDCDDNSNYNVNITKFQKLMGKFIYLTVTRSYISYVVQVLSQYMHKPHKSHLNVAFRLLQYLKDCPRKGVLFSKSNSFNLVGYVDVDWAKCLSTRMSITSYLAYFGYSMVSWKSKKQSTVSRSSNESE